MAGVLGHPFVFAFWAVREDRASAGIGDLLRRSYAAGRGSFAEMVRREAAASGLSEAVVEDYLRHALHFELDAGDLEGLRLFYRLAAEEGLIPSARPLAFTPQP